MKTFTATELKNKTGQFIESALKEPIEIMKSGRTIAVVLPKDEYDRLQSLADAYWADRARNAEATGWASRAEITALLHAAKRA
jgi:prevent-host-death family protein